MVECIGQQAYKLRLPEHWNIHPVFHVTLLRPWREDTWSREDDAPDPELEVQSDDDEYEIEKLLRWRIVREGNRRVREFLVLWKGWGLDDASWVRETDIRPARNVQMMLERDQLTEDIGGGSNS